MIMMLLLLLLMMMMINHECAVRHEEQMLRLDANKDFFF
jgi:hypothetical protein